MLDKKVGMHSNASFYWYAMQVTKVETMRPMQPMKALRPLT